ncbi:MAG TPA: flavin reductase family protein [Nocardioidaceae bacterium]|nr:flavin reductase family protein [Nocardioidaceae bacterium]
MPFDPLLLRRCLGHFATGVTVITCDGDGESHGATVNAFSAVSLEPPLVMVSVDRKTRICKYLEDKPFTVNVLEKPQDQVALHFAGKPMSDDPRWEQTDPDLAPQLSGSLATISCTPWRSYDGGDHVLYLGEVQKFASTGAEPLVFYLGAFRHLGPVFETVPWLESGDCPGISWFGATA